MAKGSGQVKTNSSTGTQSQGPWSGQAPYLRGMYQGAANLPLQQHYPGQSVADQGPETPQALGMQAATAQGGANQPRTNQWNQTLQGDYLHGGQGFNAAMKAAGDTITPMVQGQFEAGGRYGSGLAQEAETSALANAFASQYGQERGNQMQAMGMASPAYTDSMALGNVGMQQDAYQQSLLSDQMNRWNFNQQAPYDRLQAQNAVIQAGYPGAEQSSTSAQYGPPGLFDLLSVDTMAGLEGFKDNPFGGFEAGMLGNIKDRKGSGPGEGYEYL